MENKGDFIAVFMSFATLGALSLGCHALDNAKTEKQHTVQTEKNVIVSQNKQARFETLSVK